MLITPNQTLPDVAIMATGTLNALFDVASANTKGITDAPRAGDDYSIPSNILTDATVLQYLAINNITIGTGDDVDLYTGINYWKVEIDFKVS